MGFQHTLSRQYLHNLPFYLRHDDFIDGDVSRVEKYLVMHAAERSKARVKLPDGTEVAVGAYMWQQRLQMLENDNICEPILLYWLALLSQEITRSKELEEPPWPEILEDITADGVDLDKFTRDLLWHYCGYGQIGVLCEGPADAGSGADVSRGERAAAQYYEPWLICKVERFTETGPHRGKLKEVMIIVDQPQKEGKQAGRKMQVRRFWIEEQGQNYKSELLEFDDNILDDVRGDARTVQDKWYDPLEFERIGEAMDGQFDEIPFVVFGDGPKSDSVIYTVVPRNRELLNKKSHRDTINTHQTFKKPVFIGADPEQVTMATEQNAIFLKEADASVHVIEPGNPEALNQDIEDIKREVFLDGLLRVARRHQMLTGQVESVDSKREDSSTIEAYLRYVVDIAESVINDVLRYLWRFEKSTFPETEDELLKIGRDFRVALTENEIAEEALLMSWLSDFPKAGRKAKARITATKFMEQKITVLGDQESEDAVKKEIAEEIIKEGDEQVMPTRLRDIARQGEDAGDLVRANGSVSLSDAIEQGSGNDDAPAANA